MKTSYAYPYALIHCGGQVVGQRPRTKLAFIHEAHAKAGQIVAYKIRVRKGDGWNKSTRRIDPESIIKVWRNFPSDKQIKAARSALSRAETAA